jgi:hypothetical protein
MSINSHAATGSLMIFLSSQFDFSQSVIEVKNSINTALRTRNAARESCLIDLLNAIKLQLIHNMSDLIDEIERERERLTLVIYLLYLALLLAFNYLNEINIAICCYLLFFIDF